MCFTGVELGSDSDLWGPSASSHHKALFGRFFERHVTELEAAQASCFHGNLWLSCACWDLGRLFLVSYLVVLILSL